MEKIKKFQLTPEGDGVVEETLIISREDLLDFLKEIAWKTGPDGVILNDKDEPVKCIACQREIHVDDFGAFFPGSMHAVHNDFACFAGGVFYKHIERLEQKEGR
jgi:hypothetical protein